MVGKPRFILTPIIREYDYNSFKGHYVSSELMYEVVL